MCVCGGGGGGGGEGGGVVEDWEKENMEDSCCPYVVVVNVPKAHSLSSNRNCTAFIFTDVQ